MTYSNKAVIKDIFFLTTKLHSSEKGSENGNIGQLWVNFDAFPKSFAYNCPLIYTNQLFTNFQPIFCQPILVCHPQTYLIGRSPPSPHPGNDVSGFSWKT